MFKNPKIEGCSSGKLIDEAGLKGKRIGNAQISEKHGNFIINLGGATAKDVLALMELARSEVKKCAGIELESEVRILRRGAAWVG
jgi:UDP-N-acetylmuramate dehydrogenase